MIRRSFEDVVVPHLDAAFNYARWLTRNDADAEDVVQDAVVRAFRFFSSVRTDNARSWLFTIVRRTWYARLAKPDQRIPTTEYDELTDGRSDEVARMDELLIRREQAERVRRAVEQLPADFREVIVLRELEGLSYKEIATVVNIPVGTVMSRLSRARERLMPLLDAVGATGDRK
jgi:RNA polymerase sigma-70 factor (ECF subfamily)